MTIVLCNSFLKHLKKLGSVDLDDVKTLLRKYPDTRDITYVDQFESSTLVLKCYLPSKKVRALVFLRTSQGNFIPVAVV
ncbi:MAG: hypothetical protein HQM13_03190 [SAR324 cluster bacterium]|nr:hypothetical protein [SAR324 cluster bacterium]